jgi:hypothetical protein
MKLDEKSVKRRWLEHFGLITKKGQWNHSNVSGHGDGRQIKQVIEGPRSKTSIPIHTVHEAYHERWHPNVKKAKLNTSIDF